MKYYTKNVRRWLAVAISVQVVAPSAFAVNRDGDPYIDFYDDGIRSVYVPTNSLLTQASMYYIRSNKVYVTLITEKNPSRTDVLCSVIPPKNIVPSWELPPDRTDPMWLEYTINAASAVNNCPSWEVVGGMPEITDIVSYEVTIPDGHIFCDYGCNYSGYKLKVSGLPPVPNACKAYLNQPMAFGVVRPGSGRDEPTASSLVTVECQQGSVISIEVNHGNPLLNVDGSRIDFTYKAEHDLTAGLPLTVDIRGALTMAPNDPGSYSWYAPILVSYE